MVLEFLVNMVLQIISSTGYAGILLLMAMESAVLPVPSEIVMPFAGYLVTQGRFDFWLVVLAATVGNLIGSVAAYFVGMYVGRAAIIKYGKYFLLSKHHIALSERWFKKHGDKAVFISRMLPVIRTVIALPAGIAEMNFPKFALYTFLGSIPWNAALAYVGVWFGQNWILIEKYTRWADVAIVAGILAFAAWFLMKRRK